MHSLWNISDMLTETSTSDHPVVVENHRRSQFLFTASSDPVLVLSLNGYLIVGANAAACERFKYGLQKFKGLLLDDLVENPNPLKRALKRRVALLTGVSCLGKDKQHITANLYCAYFKQGRSELALVVLRDIVNAHHAEKLRICRETLALEVSRTESAFFMGEENERQRLARELHGQIGPMMVSVKLGLEQLISAARKDCSKKDLQNLLDQHTRAIKELRITTSRLAEGFMYQEDINAALKQLLSKYAEYGGLSVYSKLDALPDNLTIACRYHLFRIVEECLTNALLHSNANKISLRLWLDDQSLHMYVLDNGRGMNRPQLAKDKGLWLMDQRAALLNGKLQIETVPERYFRVSLSIPLQKNIKNQVETP